MTQARRPFCADISAEAGEALAATASHIEHWLLIEYPGLWTRDVLAGSRLSPATKDNLRAQAARLPHTRVLFVRRPERRGRGPGRVYLIRSTEGAGQVARLDIADPGSLAELDVVALLADLDALVGHPLLVVCTHGKRDRCCARYGRPVYERLAEAVSDDWLWQSSHVGGDRFAGNLVCLPEGLFFGRVATDTAWRVLDEYLAGRIDSEHYRGRSCYSFTEQAAERAVREATDRWGIDDVRLVSSRGGGGQWDVRFAVGDEVYESRVTRSEGELTYLTCDATTLKRPRLFVAAPARPV